MPCAAGLAASAVWSFEAELRVEARKNH